MHDLDLNSTLYNTRQPYFPKSIQQNPKMGAFLRLFDTVLFLFFLLVAIAVPVIHSQDWLPLSDDQIPEFLRDLTNLYSRTTGDYLLLEKPLFFVGLVWLQLLLLWPLSVANLYAAIASKSWFSTTCLIYGVSVFSAMVHMHSLITLMLENVIISSINFQVFVIWYSLQYLRRCMDRASRLRSS